MRVLGVSLDISVIVAVVSALAAVASAFVSWSGLRRQSVPDLIAYVDPMSEYPDMAALYIRNIGSAPAYDVRTRIDGHLPAAVDKWTDGWLKTFLMTGVPMLAPGAMRGMVLGPFNQLMEDDSPAELFVSWRGRPHGVIRMSAKFPIEFKSFGGILVGRGEYSSELRRISNSLESIASEARKRDLIKRARGL